MTLLKDVRFNNNYYLIGKLNNKKYLFNQVKSFEAFPYRLEHMEEVKDNNKIKEILVAIKNNLPYDCMKIEFI